MRVIAGIFRGTQLQAPPGSATRPVTDRVKESIFDILGAHFGLPGALPAFDVLDIFAGSGALGIECLSRGARSCLFVEHDRRSLRTLRANVAKLGLRESARVSSENAWTMRVPTPAADPCGLVFVDPPFRDVENTLRVLDLLERLAVALGTGGALVFRYCSRTDFPTNEIRNLNCIDARRFGRMRVLFLIRPATETDAADRPTEREARGSAAGDSH